MEKKSIEDLSNLVFGLALTLGAVALVRPGGNDLSQLLVILFNFALSFFIIIWIWWLYNRLVKRMEMDGRLEVVLNYVLLFLVVIEPFLYTLINTSSGATIYAIDIGTALLILGVFTHLIIRKAQERSEDIRRLKFSRTATFASALVFYLSIVPGLIPDLQQYGVQGLIWLAVMLMAVLSRLLLDRHRRP